MTSPFPRLVRTPSSESPPLDETGVRWRRRPALALAVRMVAVIAPLAASVVVGILASRVLRPHGWTETIAWAVWTASASLLALWLVDAFARRLLPLHRLLQLCLAFPDRAPSRLRVAVRAARGRRPEALAGRADVPRSAAAAAERIVTLLATLAMHDRRTRGHCERVCGFTDLLAEQLRLSADERDRLTWVALVHDIGKLHVPSRLLNKPGRPTVKEWELLKTHPERGAAITEPLHDWLGEAADAVLQHHERYDGKGYPHGLTGVEISLAARVVAVSDAFEVMTAPRAYRRPVDAASARAELARHAGTQFDPDVVRAFLAVGLPALRRVMGPLAWLAELPFVSSWPRLEAATSTTAAHAMAVTAAASTAGVLAVGAAGGVATAQAAPVAGADVLAPRPPVAVADVPVATSRPAPSATAAATTAPAPPAKRPSLSWHVKSLRPVRLRIQARPQPPGQHVAPPTAAPVTDPAQPADPDTGRRHAWGHDHAPGWQKNWGSGGRQVERHRDKSHGHGSD